jgi:PST family polysaccharide transporter
LLGHKWAPAGPLLRVFAIRGIANSVERTIGWLHVVAGRSDRWMRWGVFSAACQLVALMAGLPFGSIGIAIALAYTVAIFCLFIPVLVYAGYPIGIGVKEVVSTTGLQMDSAIIAVAFGLICNSYSSSILRAGKVNRLHSDLSDDIAYDGTRRIQNNGPA